MSRAVLGERRAQKGVRERGGGMAFDEIPARLLRFPEAPHIHEERREVVLRLDVVRGRRETRAIRLLGLVKSMGSVQNAPEIVARVGPAGLDLDSEAVSKALTTLDTELASIGLRAEAFGASFDAVSFEASQLTAALNALIGQGVGPLDPRIQTIVQRLGELQSELGRREGAIAFRDWIADVNREIQALERQGVERLGDVLEDMDQRLRDMDLSPVELELQRMKAELAGGPSAQQQAIEGGTGQSAPQQQSQRQDTPRFDK